MVSAIDYARRSLVALLKALAKTYGVVLALTRESSDAQINTAVRKVSLKAHPDRGGREEDQKLLNAGTGCRQGQVQCVQEGLPRGQEQWRRSLEVMSVLGPILCLVASFACACGNNRRRANS